MVAALGALILAGLAADSPWAHFMPGGKGGGGPPGATGGDTTGGDSSASPWAQWMPGGKGKGKGKGGEGAKGGAKKGGAADSPFSKWMPGGGAGGGGGGAGGGMPGAPAGFMPFVPPAAPVQNFSEHVLGTYNSSATGVVALNLTYVTVTKFAGPMGGFMGSVEVEPWTPGAVVALNYTGTDVAIQRLFNGDVVDEFGSKVKPFDMLVGKSGQAYIVVLHNRSVHSAAGTPPNSFTWMAHGTPQPPQMSVGCAALQPGALEPRGPGHTVLRYDEGFAFPQGFTASVEVSPWVEGTELSLDFRPAKVAIDEIYNAQVLAEGPRHVYTLRLGRWSAEAPELIRPSTLVLKATGPSGHRPKLTLLHVPPNGTVDEAGGTEGSDDWLLLAARARAAPARPGGAARAAAAWSGAALGVAFAAGMLLAALALAASKRAAGAWSLRARRERSRAAAALLGRAAAEDEDPRALLRVGILRAEAAGAI